MTPHSPATCRHPAAAGPYKPGMCRKCWNELNARGGPANPPPLAATRAAEPCTLLGSELTGTQRDARGLGHAKKWSLCLHPDKPLGEVVCPCRGCGPGCRGYTPDPASQPTEMIDIPAPPPLNLGDI